MSSSPAPPLSQPHRRTPCAFSTVPCFNMQEHTLTRGPTGKLPHKNTPHLQELVPQVRIAQLPTYQLQPATKEAICKQSTPNSIPLLLVSSDVCLMLLDLPLYLSSTPSPAYHRRAWRDRGAAKYTSTPTQNPTPANANVPSQLKPF
jgi:hypothetical protein